MKTSRRYQCLPDRAACFHPGCAFHREGDTAEALGEAHNDKTGHEVRVQSAAVVIFTKPHPLDVDLDGAFARLRREASNA